MTEAQLVYAVADVTHLRDVYKTLSADLEKRTVSLDGNARLRIDPRRANRRK